MAEKSSTTASVSQLKADGNAAVQQNEFDKAISLYKKALKCTPITKEDENALYLNLALCYSKQNLHDKAIEYCSKVLQTDPMNPKALFRRSKSYMALDKLHESALDAKALQRYHPQSTAATDLIKEITLKAKNSESGARRAVSDAIKEGADPILLKQILGAVAEDESRARECVLHDGVALLLGHAKKDPLCYNIIGRLCNYESTFPKVIESFKKFYGDNKWIDELVATMKDPNLPGLHSAAILLALKAAASKDAIPLSNPVFVEALLDERVQVREVAIDACCFLYSKNRDTSELFVKDLNGIESLRQVCKEEPQLGSLCLSRVVPVLIKLDKTKDDLVLEKCQHLCAPAFDKNEDLASVDSIARVKAGLNALLAVFNASNEVALEVVGTNAVRLGELITSAPDSVVAIVAEILAQTGNSEKGRAVLGTLSPQLHALLGHSNANIRAAASVAMTKTEAVHFDSNTDQGAIVLGSVGHLFREGASPEEISRGIEAVSFVVADTDVKMMLTTGDEGTRVLKSLMARARELKEHKDANADDVELGAKKKKAEKENEIKPISAESVYGIAYLLQNLTMDEDDKKREKLREMEVSQEQWEQFEKITKQKSRPGNSRKDSPEEVAQRIDAVVNAGGIAALRSLIFHKPSATVASAVAKAMSNMASQTRVRGTMLAQGAISTLLKAHKIGHDEDQTQKSRTDTYRGSPICRDAAHALARLLITTDPRLLPNAQVMDCLAPLVDQVRKSDEDLVIFECLMALTNLEVVGDQVKDRIISLKGIHAYEYAQFSETPMVRRAATEALANLFPSDGLTKWLAHGDKTRLWILLAEDWEADMQTSRAAAGCLAQLAYEPLIASRLRRFGCTERLSNVVMEGCPFGEVVWRIAVTLQALSETEFQDTSSENANETAGVTVTNDGKWHVESGPWSAREKKVVTDTFNYILLYQPETQEEKQFWGNAQKVAKEWLTL